MANDLRFVDRQLVVTEDGSHSVYLPALAEHYHSSYGALAESRHVFIRHGFQQVTTNGSKPLRVLEVGFGTGLNALLTWQEASATAIAVSYTAFEAFPVEEQILSQLNHAEVLGTPTAPVAFSALHCCPWGERQTLASGFSLLKVAARFETFRLSEGYDLVYFDAFSPAVQPELWTAEIFASLFAGMHPGALLVTYCAKGEVRRNLKAAGFVVERLPGPPGKREMTRARKE